jgi:hypothetical protein
MDPFDILRQMDPRDILRLIAAMCGLCVGLWFFMGAAVVGEFIVRKWLAIAERAPERAYYDPPAPPMRSRGDRAVSLGIARIQQRRWALCASGRAVAVTLQRTEELLLLAQDHIVAGQRSKVRQKMMEWCGMASPNAAAAAAAVEPELLAAAATARAAAIAADEAMAAAMALPAEAVGMPVVTVASAAAAAASAELARSHTPITVMPQGKGAAAAASAGLAKSDTPITVMPQGKGAAAAASAGLAKSDTPITVMPQGKGAAGSAAPVAIVAAPSATGPAPAWLAAETAIAQAQSAATAACARAETAAAALPRANPLRLVILLVVVLAVFGLMIWHDWTAIIGPRLNQPGG